jgi:hypothetical protein
MDHRTQTVLAKVHEKGKKQSITKINQEKNYKGFFFHKK